MATATSPHVVIINRNYPPRTGITGESACLLARYFNEQQQIRISIVTVRSSYAGGSSLEDPVGTVHEINSLYDGKKKLMRFVTSFVESFRLIWKARRLAGSSTIVMTDPPFLSLWASVLLGKKRSWILWSMDLFPDAFVASNLVSKTNVIYRALNRIVFRNAPDSLIALGPLQKSYLIEKYDKPIETAIIPCGVYDPESPDHPPSWKQKNAGKILVGYCGNLGEAHSTDFLKCVIDNLDPAKFHLVLSVYGVRSHEILEYASTNTQGITILPSVSRAELSFIDIHLVSLLKHWAHICVPSKAVSAVCSGSTFLFYGTAQCDNWLLLKEAGWIIEQNEDVDVLARDVAAFMQRIESDEIRSKKQQAHDTAGKLQNMVAMGFSDVANLVLRKRR